jgi:hypothetical protein
VPFRVFGIAARPRPLPVEFVLFWNQRLLQRLSIIEVSPLLVLRPRSAVSTLPRLCGLPSMNHRRRPIKLSAISLSASFTLPLEFYPAIPTPPSKWQGPLMGFVSLQHIRISRSTFRELAHSLRSAFRVWLPSWRLAPSNSLPVLFRTGSARGI